MVIGAAEPQKSTQSSNIPRTHKLQVYAVVIELKRTDISPNHLRDGMSNL